MDRPRKYITTPIYYVNDEPHIGHAYTTTLCDIWARMMRACGEDVFFLTGTDEHGQKVEQSAAARDMSPRELADRNSTAFRSTMDLFELTYDDFIRTTDPEHERQVQAFIEKLLARGDIYVGTFEGWYDEGQEEYHTETSARDLSFASPVSGKPLVRATEENYYFRLSAYQERLEQLLANRPDMVRPAARRNEVLGRLRDGLQDVPISRTNFSWGIPMPGDPNHVIYVWIDALFNYATALGLGEEHSERWDARHEYWPATYHIIGKEILWFHAVIWPAILLALELPVPHCVYAHSFWISEGQKMSKSLGNFIDLNTIRAYIDRYSIGALRYFLATQGPLGATDADFVTAKFHDVYTSDLVNTVGNSTSRVTAMIGKYFDGALPSEESNGSRMVIDSLDWPARCEKAVAEAIAEMEQFNLDRSIEASMSLIREVDLFINTTEPFKLAKDPERRDELAAILYQCLEALRIASLLLACVLPQKTAEFSAAIGAPTEGTLQELAAWGGLSPGSPVTKVALFPRVELAAMSS